MREPLKFLCDHMLGTLAKWLRFMGYNASYPGPLSDRELVERARSEGRILLTRDKDLGSRVENSLYVPMDDLEGQLRFVVGTFHLNAEAHMTLCSLCNLPVESVDLNEVGDNVPPGVKARQKEFWRCPSCGRFYWQGSHWDRVLERLRGLGL